MNKKFKRWSYSRLCQEWIDRVLTGRPTKRIEHKLENTKEGKRRTAKLESKGLTLDKIKELDRLEADKFKTHRQNQKF